MGVAKGDTLRVETVAQAGFRVSLAVGTSCVRGTTVLHCPGPYCEVESWEGSLQGGAP